MIYWQPFLTCQSFKKADMIHLILQGIQLYKYLNASGYYY